MKDREYILSRFRVKNMTPKRTKDGDKYVCTCPCHDDKNASLDITFKKDKVMFHCHGKCETSKILGKVGLTWADIGCQEPKKAKWIGYIRNRYKENGEIIAIYNYKSDKGEYLYSKIRFENKAMCIGRVDTDKDKISLGRGNVRPTLYNLESLLNAIKGGYPVYIVEGEKDVETLKKYGLVATTPGSADDWKKEFSRFFIGADVIILRDNDVPGEKLQDEIINDLKDCACRIRWTKTSKQNKGDVTDYLTTEGHSKRELLELVNNIGENNTYTATWISQYKNGNKTINADILADQIRKTTDFILVKSLSDDKEKIYLYENGVYTEVSKNRLKARIKSYIPKGLANNYKLEDTLGLLLSSEDNKIVSVNDLNSDETYINLKNGLYNVKTRELEPHSSQVLTTNQLNCNYEPGEHNCPTFDRYINDLCSDDEGRINESKKALLQEYGGLILSNINVSRKKTALVLYSQIGNTGKSQFISLLQYILGVSQVTTIQLQDMNEKSKFAIGSIVDKRLISMGDGSGASIKDDSIFKALTGGDCVKVEQKGKQPYSYNFKGGIIIACNNLPSFTGDKGSHLFERLQIVPCLHVIPYKQRDTDIILKMEKEIDSIFSWFLEGLHRLMDNNYHFTRCIECEKANKEYRTRLDTVYSFISSEYEITGNKGDLVIKTDFENDYIKYCERNGLRPVNKRNIKDRMCAIGIMCKQARPIIEGTEKPGTYCYIGITQKIGVLNNTKIRNIKELA